MTATVAMVATAALTTHFMLRCISLYILFNNLTFFLILEHTQKKRRESSYVVSRFVDAVSVLQKIESQRQQSTITTTTASTK